MNYNNSKYLLIFLFTIGNFLYSQEFNENNFDDILIKKNQSLKLMGQYNNAVELNREYLKKAIEQDYLQGQVLCFINLAGICTSIDKYKFTFLYLKMAEVQLNRINVPYLSAKLNQEYCIVNALVDLFQSALMYNAKAIHYLESVDKNKVKEYNLSYIYVDRANLKYATGDTCDSSMVYIRKALKIDRNPSTLVMATKLNLHCDLDLDSAIRHLHEAENLFSKEKVENTGKASFNLMYGDYYIKIKKYEEAIYRYKESARIYSNMYQFRDVMYVYEKIAGVYKTLNNVSSQHIYLEKYLDVKKIVEENRNEAVSISIEKLLSEEKVLSSKHSNKIYEYVYLFILLITICICTFYWNYKKKDASNIVLTQKNALLEDKLKNDFFDELVSLVKKNDSSFLSRFEEIYPEFRKELLLLNSNISSSDLTFCAMVRLNFSSKEIAAYTFVQHKSVQQRKYRIRIKLNIPSDKDLYLFFKGLDNKDF
ncbi:hypothetical protein [Chryseobacterium sp. OV279]|uniref:hypothetical protein n=1 Tax=Chryseobacterium sp. OV279 TaxID=1500285 RepID=UPI00090FD6A3|nr:hypothetical protein [Chryseobacterium sp. OV279]SHF38450.1 hypothetical protein SAMN02787100_1830 [Chryseobacterium sp. OV279]